MALDEHLDHPVSLVFYGRSALTLDFHGTAEVGATKDVDATIRRVELDARDAVNARFLHGRIYITHLFQADQVFLRPDWELRIVLVPCPPTRWLKLFRPATADLILTKIMRGNDPQDMQELHDAFALALPVVRKLLSCSPP